MIDDYNQAISVDRDYIGSYLCRADAALWANHPNAQNYLDELEAVLKRLPYSAAGCKIRARAILSSPQGLRDPLTPLALSLARKAVQKEPENPDFLRTLGEALCHTEDRENAEAILLTAFDLSIAASDPHDPKTARIVQLLIQLYESWDRPDEAAKWRSTLPKTNDAEQ